MVTNHTEINPLCRVKSEWRRTKMEPRSPFKTKRQNTSSFNSGWTLPTRVGSGDNRTSLTRKGARQERE